MSYFSNTYLGARTKFKKYSRKPGVYTDKIKITDVEGSEGESLFIDVSYIGSLDPSYLYIHSSGVGGVSGYIGSAIQCAILDKHLPNELPSECAVLFIHAVNPYGMSHYRKWNENNVDLDKNFYKNKINKCKHGYEILNETLNPTEEPTFWMLEYYKSFIELKILGGYKEYDLKNDIYFGQGKYSKGLYYWGEGNEQCNVKLLNWIRDKFPNVLKIFHLDVDSNFGFDDINMKFYPKVSTFNGEDLERFEKNFNIKGIVVNSQGKIDYGHKGTFMDGVKNLFTYEDESIKDADYFGLKQSFQTYSDDYGLQTLIIENYFHNQTNSVETTHYSKVDLFESFFPRSKTWRKNTLKKGIEAFINGTKFCLQ